MAIIFWQLGDFIRPRPAAPAWVRVENGRVIDVDAAGWDQGIRPGMAAAELKWRYPAARLLPRPPAGTYAAGWERELQDLALPRDWEAEAGRGWWEWPQPDEASYRQLAATVIPARAGRLAGGIAGHPWLARWVAGAGAGLGLPVWRGQGWETAYLPPAEEAAYAGRLPLDYVPAPAAVRRQWADQGWRRAGEVPGLLPLPAVRTEAGPEERLWRWPLTASDWRRWGIRAPEVARAVAEEALRWRPAWADWEVEWEGVPLPPRRRDWPPAGEGRVLAARLLSLLMPPPDTPPAGVRLKGRVAPRPLQAAQERWGWAGFPLLPAAGVKAAGVTRGRPLSRRERMLGYWDPWRGGGAS